MAWPGTTIRQTVAVEADPSKFGSRCIFTLYDNVYVGGSVRMENGGRDSPIIVSQVYATGVISWK